jgi:hypothetical protein
VVLAAVRLDYLTEQAAHLRLQVQRKEIKAVMELQALALAAVVVAAQAERA